MKTLIHNYSSTFTIEPMYFSKCLEMVGVDAAFWANPSVSAYDMFDATLPDVFISHFAYLTQDIVKYLDQSSKNIEVILNVTGCSEEQLAMVDSLTSNNKLKIPFVFSNTPDNIIQPKTKTVKSVNILPAVDIFVPAGGLPDYNIDVGIVYTQPSDLLEQYVKDKDNYHLLCLGDSKEADLNVTIQSLRSLYSKYKEVTLLGNIGDVYSQIMLETMMFSDKATIKVPQEQEEVLGRIFQSLFSDDNSSEDMSQIVKSQVKRKHTCISRAARLCRFLKNEEAATKLEKMRDQL